MNPLTPIVLVLLAGSAPATESAPAFTKKPTAARSGGGVTIEFTADRPTDVAVTVEDARGRIVRHLGAGVLGKNPPEPLRPGSLRQSLVWDGKDDLGKVAAGGPFRVRVGLGLRPAFDRFLMH